MRATTRTKIALKACIVTHCIKLIEKEKMSKEAKMTKESKGVDEKQ
jgi:hypothetical protein